MTDQLKDFPIAKEGAHPSMLTRIVRCGIHNIPGYEGAPAADKPQIALCWELLDEKRTDDKAWDVRTFGQVGSFNEFYTEKGKLNKFFQSMFLDYKEGDRKIEKYLGELVFVNMIHKPSKDGSRTFANLKSLSPWNDLIPKDGYEAIGETVFFDFYKPTKESWDKLTQPEQEYILQAKDYNGSALAKLLGTEFDESVDY